MSLESLKEGFANQVIYQKWKQKENNHFQANYWVTKLYLHLRPSIYSIQQIKLCFSQLQATSTMSSITMDLVNWLSVHCCTASCAVRMWRLQKRQQKNKKKRLPEKQYFLMQTPLILALCVWKSKSNLVTPILPVKLQSQYQVHLFAKWLKRKILSGWFIGEPTKSFFYNFCHWKIKFGAIDIILIKSKFWLVNSSFWKDKHKAVLNEHSPLWRCFAKHCNWIVMYTVYVGYFKNLQLEKKHILMQISNAGKEILWTNSPRHIKAKIRSERQHTREN